MVFLWFHDSITWVMAVTGCCAWGARDVATLPFQADLVGDIYPLSQFKPFFGDGDVDSVHALFIEAALGAIAMRISVLDFDPLTAPLLRRRKKDDRVVTLDSRGIRPLASRVVCEGVLAPGELRCLSGRATPQGGRPLALVACRFFVGGSTP